MVDHSLPGRRIVVGAVDPHAVHAGGHEIADKQVVGAASPGIVTMMRTVRPSGGAPNSASVCDASRTSPSSFVSRAVVHRRVVRETFENVKDFQDRLEAVPDVRFRAPERRQPVRREQELRVPEVVPAERQVVQQVPGARLLSPGIALRYAAQSRSIRAIAACTPDSSAMSEVSGP